MNFYNVYIHIIKTHDSESQGQEAAVRDERVIILRVALLKNLQTLIVTKPA